MAEMCADLNRDGVVNFVDLSALKGQFGQAWSSLQVCFESEPVATMVVPGTYTDGSEIEGAMTVRVFEISPGCYRATVADSAGTESMPSEIVCAE